MTEVFVETNDFKVVLEMEMLGVPYVYIHIEVYNWNHKICKELRELFNEVVYQCGESGLDEVYAYTPSLKFADLICPYDEYIGLFQHEDKEYHVISWYTVHKLI